MLVLPPTAIRLYATAAAAQSAIVLDADDDWTYAVVSNDSGKFLIEIRDEDGEFVAYFA